MLLIEVLIVAGLLFAVAAVAAGRGDALAPPQPDSTDTRLPAPGAPVQPDDVADVRFGLAFRGYRMAEVDDVLDRLADELARRDARIAELTAAGPEAAPEAAPEASPAAAEAGLGWPESLPERHG